MEKLKRENWVDLVKVAAITMVVFLHINQDNIQVMRFIIMFIIPLFFIASGYLYKPRATFAENMRKLGVTLVVPYLLIGAVSVAADLALSWGKEGFSPMAHLAEATRKVLLAETGMPLVGPMWFVASLFTVRIVTDAIAVLTKHHTMIVLNALALACMPLTYFVSKHMAADSVYAVLTVPFALPFFVWGHDMKRSGLTQKLRERKSMLAVATLLTAVLSAAIYIYIGDATTNVSRLLCGRNIVSFYAGAIAGSGIMICLAMFFERFTTKAVPEICKGMLVIVGWHYPLLKAVLGALGISQTSPLVAALIAVVTVVCFYPVIIFLSRYAPIFLGNRK